MRQVEIHARYLTSEYDHGEGPGALFDDDAHEGAIRATHSVLVYLRHLANEKKYLGKYKAFDESRVLEKVEPALSRIARKYWSDQDYDARMKLVQVREEVKKLTSALAGVISTLKQRPPYVRSALNYEAGRLTSSNVQHGNDIFGLALNANSALLTACEFIISRDREDPGEAIRYRNVCYELAQLWEEMLGRKFPKTTKYADGKIEEITGVKAAFDSPAAQFVCIAIFQMGLGWVKPSQVEAGIKALPKREKRSSSEG